LLSRKTFMNRFRREIQHLLPVLLLLALSATVWGQQDSASGQDQTGQDQTGQDQTGAPPAATGPADTNLENPPLSGLDAPRSEPAFGGRSYLIPGLQFSEGIDSNANGSIGGGRAAAVSRALGSLDMQRLWKKYSVALDYVGGGVFYFGPRIASQSRAYQVHTFAADQRYTWRTGQFAIRDCLDYLPEGTFGMGSFGGAGSISDSGEVAASGASTGMGGTAGCSSGSFGAGQIGSIGFQPRISNVSVADVTEQLSPRTSVTLSGGFSVTDFLNKSLTQSQAGFNIINSQQTTAQAGYNRLLTRKDQLSFIYAFQEFHFPVSQSASLHSHVWSVLYSHRITGRLNFVAGGGPQVLEIHNPAQTIFFFGIPILQIPASTTRRVSANGTVTLGYTVSPRTNGQLTYRRYFTPGSGFVAGALTDTVRLSVSHTLGRRWTSNVDAGFSHNSALQNSQTAGINARNYEFWYGGGSLHRRLGVHFSAFVSYQFDDFIATQCVSSTGPQSVCGQSSHRSTATLGINWHPRPIRLD